MRCPVCESTINDACRFCTVCGSPIEGPSPADAEGPLPGSSAAASTSETERARAAVEPQSSEANDAKGKSFPAESPLAGESGATDAEPATFAAVMDDTRRRSKRRMPLVVMLALAVALAAGTAFAAYQVYVNVIAPAQTQDRAQPSEPVAESPAPDEPLSIDVEERQLVVSTMGDPFYGDGTRTDNTWTYPELVASRQSDAVDAVNAFVKRRFEQDAAATEKLDADNYMDPPGETPQPGVIIGRSADVTFLSDRYVCIFDSMYTTWWGAHGNAFNESYVFDLETGEQVSVAQAAGMSEEDLKTQAESAVRIFHEREGSDIYTVDEVVEYATKGTYYLADEGVVLATDDYALGSYAYSRRNIVVIPFDDSIEAGQVLKVNATQ